MKRLSTTIFLLAFSLGILNTFSTKAQVDYNDYDYYDNNSNRNYSVGYQDFYDDLAPYGRWIYDQHYGYVWMPDVGPDFKPYFTNGYWAMTQYGNTWVSHYNWGWAPFHYGRWTYDGYYGWLWIPGTEWAPAWVAWRSNNNYYGWAPLGPNINISVSLNLLPMDWWIFISPNYFYSNNFHRHCDLDWRFTRGMYHQTNYITYNYHNTYYTGPRADDYRRTTGRRPSMFNIENNSRRGRSVIKGNNLSMYRPSVNAQSQRQNAPKEIVHVDRSVSRSMETYNSSNSSVSGRKMVLSQQAVTNSNNTNRPSLNNNNVRTNNQDVNINNNRGSVNNSSNNVISKPTIDNSFNNDRQSQQIEQQRIQQQTIRNQQIEQQRIQQQTIRNQQIEQQRIQQQNIRNQQIEQQRIQQQNIRNQQIEQQRIQQQNIRNQQIEQQRRQERSNTSAPQNSFNTSKPRFNDASRNENNTQAPTNRAGRNW